MNNVALNAFASASADTLASVCAYYLSLRALGLTHRNARAIANVRLALLS